MLQIHTKKGTISSSLIIRRKGWRDRRREQSPWVLMGSYSLDTHVRISGRKFLILSPVIRMVGFFRYSVCPSLGLLIVSQIQAPPGKGR